MTIRNIEKKRLARLLQLRKSSNVHAPFDQMFLESYRAVLNFIENNRLAKFKKGQTIIHPQQNETIIGLVIDGIVKVTSGPPAIRALDQAGIGGKTANVIGEGFWIGLESLYAAPVVFSYVALTNAEVICLERDQVIKEFDSKLLMDCLRQTLHTMTSHSLNVMYLNAPISVKVLKVLMQLRYCTARTEINISLKVIAEMIGSSYSNVSPVMKKLENLGLVERGRNIYMLSDRLFEQEYVEEAFRALLNN